MKKYSINLKRVITNIFIIFCVIVLVNIILNFTSGAKHIDTKTVTVSSNDTLWSIATDICKSSNDNLNVQNIVIEIKEINNLKSSNIYLGQELNIPVYN